MHRTKVIKATPPFLSLQIIFVSFSFPLPPRTENNLEVEEHDVGDGSTLAISPTVQQITPRRQQLDPAALTRINALLTESLSRSSDAQGLTHKSVNQTNTAKANKSLFSTTTIS